jgi:hydrogenase nickel incorporation protein HypA/HybF
MHELSIARNIVAIVAEAAGSRPVRRVTLEIGRFSCVLPESLEFCFDAVARGTALEGAVLEIRRLDGDVLNVKSMELEEAS